MGAVCKQVIHLSIYKFHVRDWLIDTHLVRFWFAGEIVLQMSVFINSAVGLIKIENYAKFIFWMPANSAWLFGSGILCLRNVIF